MINICFRIKDAICSCFFVARKRFKLQFPPKGKNQTYQVSRQTKVCSLGERKMGISRKYCHLGLLETAKTPEEFVAITLIS
jgi:hypothetical protein